MALVEIPEIAYGPTNIPLPGASVEVRRRSDNALVPVWSAETGGTSVSTAPQTTTDSMGRIQGWVAPGSYNLIVSKAGYNTYTQPYEAVSGTPLVENAAHYGSDFAAIQSAVTAVEDAGGGDAFVPKGTWTTTGSTPIRLRPNNDGSRGWVRLVFEAGAKLVTTASCPRAIDFWRQADYDVFRKIAIINPQIDAAATTGANALVGGWQAGTHLQRVSYEDILIEEPYFYNLASGSPTAGTGVLRAHIWLDSHQPSPYTDVTPQTFKRIHIVRPRLFGGDMGIGITCGPAGASSPNGTNVYYDDIRVSDPYVELNAGVPGATFYTQSGIIIGGSGYGGTVRITNPIVKNSADVAIEVNAAQDLVVQSPVTENSKVGVYLNNYHPAQDVDTQRAVILNPRHTVTSAWTAVFSRGISTGSTNPYGRVVVRNQGYVSDGQGYTAMGGASGLATYIGNAVRRVDIDGLRAVITNLTLDSASAHYVSALEVESSYVGAVVDAKNLDAKITGSKSGAGQSNVRTFAVRLTDGTVRLGPRVTWDLAITSATASTLHGVGLGENTGSFGNSILRGFVLGCTALGTTGDSAPQGVRIFPGASSGSVIPARFLIGDCDFSRLSGGTFLNDIVHPDSVGRSRLQYRNILYRGGSDLIRKTSADAAYTMNQNDAEIIAFTSLTATRTVTLPSAASQPVGRIIMLKDESGSASGTVKITATPNGTDQINGTNAVTDLITVARGTARLYSSGSAWFTV